MPTNTSNGPEAIRWIRPRDAWTLERLFWQPQSLLPWLIEGVSRQESLPLGHVSFHAALLVPERIQTPVHFELKPDLLAVLRDVLK